jgi:trk system potassium uptake protein
LMAQEHDVPSLVSVVHDPDHLPVFNKIGVTLIENPQRLIADQLYHSVRFPGIEDFIQLGENIELIEVSIEAHSPAANHSLSEINEQQLLPESCLLVLVKRDDTIVTPRGTTTLQEDDLVTAICNEADLSEVVDTLHGSAA